MLYIIRNASVLLITTLLFSLTNLTIWFFIRDPVRQRRAIQRSTCFWIRTGLPLIGVRVSVQGAERLAAGKSRLIVANHISTLDILVLYAARAATFVAAVEVGSDGFAGFLSKVGGAMFIDRRSVKYLRREIAAVADLLGAGFDVVIFPEGTTSDGRGPLLPFKTAFLAAAAQKEADILPVAVRYLTVDGEPATGERLEKIAYYGDMPFMTHLKRLLANRSVEVRVTLLEPVAAGGRSRDELGKMLRERMQAARDE